MNTFMENHIVQDCFVILDMRGPVVVDRVFTDEDEADGYFERWKHVGFVKICVPLIILTGVEMIKK